MPKRHLSFERLEEILKLFKVKTRYDNLELERNWIRSKRSILEFSQILFSFKIVFTNTRLNIDQ